MKSILSYVLRIYYTNQINNPLVLHGLDSNVPTYAIYIKDDQIRNNLVEYSIQYDYHSFLTKQKIIMIICIGQRYSYPDILMS